MNPRDFDIGVLSPIANSLDALSWFTLFICLILIAIARATNYGYILELFNPSTNFNQKSITLNSRSSYALLINYLLISALYLTLLFNEYGGSQMNTLFFLIVFLSFTVLLSIKIGIMYLLANWFNRKFYFDINNSLRYFQIIGILLVPIVGFTFFQSTETKHIFLIINTFIGISTFIYFLYKSLKVAIQLNISLFYIILYLCTLEILPTLLLGKYLLG